MAGEAAFHREVITPQVEHVMANLVDLMPSSEFYLAGGTGLALRLGHRRSHDLDFFFPQPFDDEQTFRRLQDLPGFVLHSRSPQTIHAESQSVHFSFLGFSYPLLFPTAKLLGVPIADPRDISCMKLNDLAGRGSRRDFVDLLLVAREHGLRQIWIWFESKFSRAGYSKTHILKSLTYFEDAEKEPMPDMLVHLPWEDVKAYCLREALRL